MFKDSRKISRKKPFSSRRTFHPNSILQLLVCYLIGYSRDCAMISYNICCLTRWFWALWKLILNRIILRQHISNLKNKYWMIRQWVFLWKCRKTNNIGKHTADANKFVDWEGWMGSNNATFWYQRFHADTYCFKCLILTIICSKWLMAKLYRAETKEYRPGSKKFTN